MKYICVTDSHTKWNSIASVYTIRKVVVYCSMQAVFRNYLHWRSKTTSSVVVLNKRGEVFHQPSKLAKKWLLPILLMLLTATQAPHTSSTRWLHYLLSCSSTSNTVLSSTSWRSSMSWDPFVIWYQSVKILCSLLTLFTVFRVSEPRGVSARGDVGEAEGEAHGGAGYHPQ